MQTKTVTTPKWRRYKLWCFSSWMMMSISIQSLRPPWSAGNNKSISRSHLPVRPLGNPICILNQRSHKCTMNVIIKGFWTLKDCIQATYPEQHSFNTANILLLFFFLPEINQQNSVIENRWKCQLLGKHHMTGQHTRSWVFIPLYIQTLK